MPDETDGGVLIETQDEWAGRDKRPVEERHRTEREALQEVKDRIEYFCSHLDGTWDPPWAKEIYEIAFEGLTGRYPDE